MKKAFAALLIVLMALTSTFLQATVAYQPAAPPFAQTGCGKKCGVRCNKATYVERCLKFCGICCNKCNGCVPSGTYGNKSECPCYRDMKNSKGSPKCP